MFYGEREIMRSDHEDDVESGAIIQKCRVMDVAGYQEAKGKKKGRSMPDDIFFCRYTYLAGKKQMAPYEAQVYCVCSMPVSRGRLMQGLACLVLFCCCLGEGGGV
jgi:hypothetical protein